MADNGAGSGAGAGATAHAMLGTSASTPTVGVAYLQRRGGGSRPARAARAAGISFSGALGPGLRGSLATGVRPGDRLSSAILCSVVAQVSDASLNVCWRRYVQRGSKPRTASRPKLRRRPPTPRKWLPRLLPGSRYGRVVCVVRSCRRRCRCCQPHRVTSRYAVFRRGITSPARTTGTTR